MIACLIVAAVCVTPADEVRACLVDLERHVPPSRWTTTRYLSLYAVPPSEREAAAGVVSFVVNSTSRSSVIVVPDEVPGSEGRLSRIDLMRLAPRQRERREWSAVWERLVAFDPYFHLRTEVLDPDTKKRREVFTDGGWLDLAEAAELRRRTASAGALLRGDWFVARASVPPFYYLLAGVPAQKDVWHRRLGLDAAVITELEANRGANLFRSGVTAKLRRLSRWPAPLGALWNTYDSAEQSPEEDVFRNPTFGVRFDAGEHIATRANGLHEYALFDAAGRRQDAVPVEITVDDTVHPPAALVPMLSCVRCHASEDGLRSFADDQSRLLSRGPAGDRGGVELFSDDPRLVEQLAAFYGRQEQLERELKRDREDYREAVAAACGGRSPAEVGQALGRIVKQYAGDLVTPEVACRELGIDAERDASGARLPGVFAQSGDPVVLALYRGIAVQRAQWEASFSTAAVMAAEHQATEGKSTP